MSTFTILASIRDALAALDGVKTCRIGMEKSITPADYPLVRIVPRTIKDGVPRGLVREVECLVYFGMPLQQFTDLGGLEAVYEKMLPFEQRLLDAMRAADGVASVVHEETLLDEDQNAAYKTMALRVRVVG